MESSKGQVMLVNKSDIPVDMQDGSGSPITMSTKEAKALKPKRQLTEAQKKHLDDLIELNRQKREEKKQLRDGNIPSELPENMVPVIVKKRNYKQDNERNEISKRLASLELNLKQIVSREDLEKMLKDARPSEQPSKNTLHVPHEKPRPKSSMKVRAPPVSDTEDTEQESDSEDEVKYVRKATRRLETVRQITEQLEKPRNRYSGMSIF
jgi:hypothetical protein